MGTWAFVKGVFVATWSGLRHLTHPRMTLRYPEQKLDLQGPGYQFDAKKGVGLPGFKGRHILFLDKCTGCQLCAIACDGIAVAIEMQHVQKGKPQNKKDIWPAVDYGRCVAPWTSIVTSSGIKQIKDVQIGDKVLTHAGKFRTVTQTFTRKYTGRLYKIRTLGNVEELTATEDHPILVQMGAATTWLYPNEIKYRTYLTRPIVKDTVPVANVTYSYDLYHPSGRTSYFTRESVSLDCSPDLMRLVGYYLAEGSSDRYRVNFDINKKERPIQDHIVSAAAKVFRANVSLKPDPDSAGLKLTIDSVRVAAFFHQFGQHAHTKEMPGWMLSIPLHLQRNLIRAVFLGDGHYCDRRYQYKTKIHSKYFTIRTTSYNLAAQMLFILGRLGIVASVSPNRQKKRKLCYSVTVHTPYLEKMARICGVKAKNNKPSHSYIHMRNGMIISPVTKIEAKQVTDFEVVNLEVGDDHSYVAANQSVHNCVFCGLCVEPDTPVITNPGLVAMSELAVGDRVLTHSGDYKPVTKIWDMTYTGLMYRIYVYGKPMPLVCTADHPILAVSRPSSNRKDKRLLRVTSPLELLKPAVLKNGDYVVSSIVKRHISTDYFEKDVPVYRGGVAKRRLRLHATPDLFRLIGYYLAEGSCNGGREVNFDFNVTEKNTYASDCARLIKQFFKKEPAWRKNGQNGIRLILYSAVAEDFFSQFGRGAPNKKLPDWVFFAEPWKQLELVKGEWQGDGCNVNQARQKYLNITTTSKSLAFQLQAIYARLGIVATIDSEDAPGKRRAYRINVFGRWALKLANMWKVGFEYRPTKHVDKFLMDENYVYLPIRRIETEPVENHRVMDVTVEADHTFSPAGIVTSNCVDACPFDALFMTNDYELSAYDKDSLKYTPDMLAVPPKLEGKTYKVKFDTERGTTSHG